MECKEQIAASVPLWASWLFMILGFALAILGIFWLFANALTGNVIAIGIGVGILALGVASLWHGMQSLL